MASLEIPNELLVEIFLRLTTPEDLIRASAVCVSFRRLIADRSFLRRFRKLHPPPLLGFIDYSSFHPAAPPAASAIASAADFDFAFLPAPAFDWSVREVRDGRVLLDRSRQSDDELGSIFKEMVVCDPLHRQYRLLPPLPDDLSLSVVCALLIEGPCFGESFLAPPGDDEDEEAAATETSFRVIWMMLLETKPMAAVFSSRTGQWRVFPSLTRIESLPGFVLSTWMVWFVSRHYAHGCFYWVSGSTEKLLMLDIQRMEFSMVDHPPCDRHSGSDVAIVEAGQGMTVMYVPKPDTSRRCTVWRSNGGSSTQWQMDKETFSLDSGCLMKGAVGRHLLLYHVGSSSINQGCYTRDVDTFQLERVCASCPHPSEAYYNFPPSLLSSPTVSSGSRSGAAPLPGCRRTAVTLRSSNRRGARRKLHSILGFRIPRPRPVLQRLPRRRPVHHHDRLRPVIGAPATSAIPQGTRRTDVQGAGDDAPVPELREADPGGVQGSVIAAAARAPNPLFVVKGTCGTDVQGAGNDVSVPERQEADPGGVQGPVARALNPLFIVEATPHADVHGARNVVPVPEPREAGPGGVTLCKAATLHADTQGVEDAVSVPELQETDPGGMEGQIVAAAARAPNPLFIVEATPHADVPGVGDAVPVPEVREAGPGGVTLFNAGTPHADVVQGTGVIDVLVPGPQEADPVVVQGPVVAAAGQAPNPLLVVDNNEDAEGGHGGARRRRRWGWTCGGCRAG